MLFALAAVFGGLGLMVALLVAHRRAEHSAIDELLDLMPVVPWPTPAEDGDAAAGAGAGSGSGDGGNEAELEGLAGRATDLASQVVDKVDHGRALGLALERARLPIRPGEYLIVTAASGLAGATLLLALTGSALVGLAGPVAAAAVSTRLISRRIAKRKKAFEAQLPDALGLVASSLSAGHTFLRAIQMMCEEAGPPISEEFALVVAETRLGDPLVDSLERMAERLQVRDMDMVVQAVRIQQTVGGRLATLLYTLSDFIRMRGELRREVQILTAEGRMSAYVLAGIVPFLFLTMVVLNPGYVEPLYSGWGLMLLVGCGVSVVAGLLVILRMVKIDV